jgi:hypothetical protein
MLDGIGNTYVLSPRAGNPAVSGTSEDILLRKLNDSGVTVGYLSLAGYLMGQYGVAMNVTNSQMQGLPTGENVCVSFTGVTVSDSVSSAYIVLLRGGTSGSAITVDAIQVNDGVYFPGAGRINYSVIGLKPGEETVDGPQLRWLYKLEQRFENPILSEETTYLNCSTEITPTGFSLAIAFPYVVASRIGFEAEGAGSTSDQVAITTKDGISVRIFSRGLEELTSALVEIVSAVPHTTTRAGNDWLVYGQGASGEGEFLLKYPSVGDLTATNYTISDATGAPYYVGNSLTSSRGRAYLAGGPTIGAVQGVFSSFNTDGELVYSAG